MTQNNRRDELMRQVMQVNEQQAKILSIYDRQRENDKLNQRRKSQQPGNMNGMGRVISNVVRSPETFTSIKPRELPDLENRPRIDYAPVGKATEWICNTCHMPTDGKTYYGYMRTKFGETVACPTCSPSVMRATQKKNATKYIADLVKESIFRNLQNLPSEAPDLTMTRFPGRGDQQARQAVQDFVNGDYNEIMLTGLAGRGKTGLAIAAVNDLRESGEQVLFLPVKQYIDLLQANFKAEHDNHIKTIACSVEVLVLDDLGTERVTESGFSVEEFQYLVDERHARGLRTLITTNMTLQGLGVYWRMKKYEDTGFQPGERLVSRLGGWYKQVSVGGEDLRR